MACMEMNFSRAVAIIKSTCPHRWGRMHAQALATMRECSGIRGVYTHLLFLLDAVEDWDDGYGAVAFLRDWAERHREEAEHVT